MPRLPRTDFPGAWHHVMNRVAVGRELFATASDCELFLEGLGEASARYAIEVHAYCLMTNHFHLLLMSKSGRLSDFMRFVVGRFTRLHNLRRAADGALFRSRFTSKLIDTDAHLMECLRYIHLNPLKAGLTSDADGWEWSSARAYAGSTEMPAWLSTSELLGMFGTCDPLWAYGQFMREGLQSGVRPSGSDTDR